MDSEITSAIASLKTVAELAKAAHGLANYNELVAAVSEVNTKLLAATAVALASLEKQLALNEQVSALKQELMGVKDWERESQDYVLQAVGLQKRHFAQVYKPAVQSAKPRHWACAKCFQERKIYVLSTHGHHDYKCPNCGNEITPIVQGGTQAPIDSAYE